MTFASIRDAAQEIAKKGQILPHQLAALTALDAGLTPAQRQQFTDDWRATGSPAAPAPPRPTNPLTGFPYFSQINDGPDGWRHCQTSSIAMCLAFMGVGSISDDLDYLKVVERYGDTTDQAAHAKALASLHVQARFVTTCSAAQLQAEIRGGLPAAIGILHHGPVSAPSGGGHWLACYGFDFRAWAINDPYGELDLVNGTWARQGGNSGQGVRYSFQNLNPRWLAEGPSSGWAWLFS